MNPQQAKDPAAPLYITCGPPCCGKTTWLKHRDVVDVALDDQRNVWIPIPRDLFGMSPAEMQGQGLSPDHRALLTKTFFQKDVMARLLSPEERELRCVLQRLSGRIDAAEFERSLRSLPPVHGDAERVLQTLMGSTTALLDDQQPMSEWTATVNLFVRDALFQKGAGRTGIEMATNILRQTPRLTAVAWGNTNTLTRDYQIALEIAQEHGRPVHFCVYGDNDSAVGDGEPLFDLPKLDFRTLVDRNLLRLIQTGQYIPCHVIWMLSERAEKLVGEAMSNVGRKPGTKLDLDRQLALLADFDLREDRTVRKRTTEYPSKQWKDQDHHPTGRDKSSWRSNDGTGRKHKREDPRFAPRWSHGPPPNDYRQQRPPTLPHRNIGNERYRGEDHRNGDRYTHRNHGPATTSSRHGPNSSYRPGYSTRPQGNHERNSNFRPGQPSSQRPFHQDTTRQNPSTHQSSKGPNDRDSSKRRRDDGERDARVDGAGGSGSS